MPAPTHAAFLRGINVGRAKRVAMADLRALVESLGYADARTLLNSGNVVFRAPRVRADEAARRIEDALERRLGVAARTTVLAAGALAAVLDEDPFGDAATDDSRVLVALVRDRDALARLAPLAARDWAPERLVVGAHAAWLWCPDGISAGTLAEAAMKAMGDEATTRNRATLRKLQALLAG